MSGLKVIIEGGLDKYSIDFIQDAEKKLDETLISMGFTRTETMKSGGEVIIKYRQFGKPTNLAMRGVEDNG